MNRVRKNRLIIIFLILLGVSSAVGLTLYALRQNINLYFTPSQIVLEQHQHLPKIRIGGMVKKNSIKKSPNSLAMEFIATDFEAEITVFYEGVLPTLFKEGQGVIADGHLDENGNFIATNILAKHDEKYMPPNFREKT